MSAFHSPRTAFDSEYRALRLRWYDDVLPPTPAGVSLSARRADAFVPAFVGRFYRYTPGRYLRMLEMRRACYFG